MKPISRTVLLNNKQIILQTEFDRSIFENISWFNTSFRSHKEITASLQDKNPYTITIVIESLRLDLRNKKEYVKKTRTHIMSKYKEFLFKMFFEQYGQREENASK